MNSSLFLNENRFRSNRLRNLYIRPIVPRKFNSKTEFYVSLFLFNLVDFIFDDNDVPNYAKD